MFGPKDSTEYMLISKPNRQYSGIDLDIQSSFAGYFVFTKMFISVIKKNE